MTSVESPNGTAPEPWYLPIGDEAEVFQAAYTARLPVLLKGPTGCGKTRFVEHMAWQLQRQLVTVACHEDLTATDLVGRYLLSGDETVWMDGPLTRSVRSGAICYLDEIVEARKDTTVVVHALSDHRRILPIEKTAELLAAHPDFLLVISYNPGYQSVLKDLKPSTRQRFVSIEFDYPTVAVEAEIIAHESGVDPAFAERLALIGERARHLREHGFLDGVSTRLLIYTAQLVVGGIPARRACDVAISSAVSDDVEVQRAVSDIVDVLLPVTVDDTTFDAAHRVLGLFADGIAGRSMHLQPVDEGDRAGWPWAADAVPDGETVRLPAAAADHRVLRAVVLHQAGYVEFGTTAVDADERDAAFATTDHPGLLLRLFTILEDIRVDAAVRRRYPGARNDLDALSAAVLAERPIERPVLQRDDLLDALQQHSAGADAGALLAAALSPSRAMVLADVLRRAAAVRHVDATAVDSVRLALEIGELVDEELPFDPDATFAVIEAPDDAKELQPPGDDPHGGDVPRPPSSDMEQGDELTRLGGQLVEMLAPDPGEPEAERPEARRPTDLIYPPTDDLHGARAVRYDEWNYHDRRYLRSWCRVLEQRLHGDDASFIGDVRRRHAVLASRIRRQFSFVRPEGWVRVHHADDGDELDIDAVIEAVVDRRTGTVPDDNVHIRRERAARDVATAFLVDLSASTSSPVVDEEEIAAVTEQDVLEYRFASYDPYDMPPPPEPSRRVLDVAKESVALMCDALEVLGDRHAVYGFSGESREHVDFHVAKEFDDRSSPSTWAAIAAMKSLRYTRMGPAVRHATAKLAAQPSRTKLLIVISDGYPQDIDYGPVRGDNEYGLQDTARALREAIDAGVHPYCVTIDPAGHDYLRRMCPPDTYVVIDDVPSLPRELATLYRAVAVTG